MAVRIGEQEYFFHLFFCLWPCKVTNFVPLKFSNFATLFNLRYFIQLAYNGTQYHGWQIQPNAASVQETLNNAMSVVLNETISCMGAGRTDTGVHAKEMYAHFDTESPLEIPLIIQKLNSFLPKDIVIRAILPVAADAHARFDAKKRTYHYYINPHKEVFQTDGSWYFHQKLELELMNLAAAELLKHTDFECFSKVNTDVNTFNCDITEAYWKKENNQLVFTITADRFLRNMVRAIVGTLINVGLKKITLTDFISIVESKDRSKAGFSVPAHGLYLTKIEYEYL